jgi:hypothetical protein
MVKVMNGIVKENGHPRGMPYFNELMVDLNDDAFFPAQIHERTRENPNGKVSLPCKRCDDSLDAYASQLMREILPALKG